MAHGAIDRIRDGLKPGLLRWPALLTGLCALALAGCPEPGPLQLQTSPAAVNFGENSAEQSFTIRNTGGGALSWTVAADAPWLSVDPAAGETTQARTSRVRLTVDREGLDPGTYQSHATVDSSAGAKTIPVAMTVPGTPVLEVDPASVSLMGAETEGVITIANSGDGNLSWSLSVHDAEGAPNPLLDALEITPTGGVVRPDETEEVGVRVGRDNLDPGVYSADLRITSNGGDADIALTVGVAVGPEMAVEPSTLDFGRTRSEMTFEVFNTGESNSVLEFALATDRPDLIYMTPESGESIGTHGSEYDAVPITVTLNRAAFASAVESGTITVSAPGLADETVTVMAEAAPLGFEGAMNRARPPYLMRFVFLLRDGTGQAIDATDPDIFEELETAFTIFEDGERLDLDETNFFVTSGHHLKHNIALVLDYTGSMFEAGPGGGQAIEEMEMAFLGFIDAMPDPFRSAIMGYYDRQQPTRLIHGFSTDRQSLGDALGAFQPPLGAHGASDIYDALIEACERLAAEDEGVLPFDDTDVRAVIFVTDGRDTSSVADASQVIDTARDLRVRLYPIAFGDDVRAGALINMAEETGGHFYRAHDAADLRRLLEHDPSRGPGAPGRIASDFLRQIVLTYVTLFQEGSSTYRIEGQFRELEGHFEEDAVFTPGGDVRAGQLALRTGGIEDNGRAEVYVRTEYVPRGVSQLRFRFITDEPFTLEPVEDGLIPDWTIIDEGAGVYTLLTTDDDYVPYGAFGDLLRLTFEDLDPSAAYALGFRVDNRIYLDPPFTRFFQYPEGIVLEDGPAHESVVPLMVEDGFDPDEPGVFDGFDD